jgi:hypothetical protein
MILSKPKIINEYISNYAKPNTNQIINIGIRKSNKYQILNADLLSKKIRIKLKSKEIGNKSIKFTILKIFNNLNIKNKTINSIKPSSIIKIYYQDSVTSIHDNVNNLVGNYKIKVNEEKSSHSEKENNRDLLYKSLHDINNINKYKKTCVIHETDPRINKINSIRILRCNN